MQVQVEIIAPWAALAFLAISQLVATAVAILLTDWMKGR